MSEYHFFSSSTFDGNCIVISLSAPIPSVDAGGNGYMADGLDGWMGGWERNGGLGLWLPKAVIGLV